MRKVSAPKVAGPESIFRCRSGQIYNGMKVRAAKANMGLPFTLADFRHWLDTKFDNDGTGRCEYSGEMILVENFSVDHRQPISRGGPFALENLALCSEKQNLRKGNMTKGEFVIFSAYVNSKFAHEVATAIWRKLEVGDVQRFSYFRRQKKERGVR